jgi:hypothetical protein
MVAGVSPLSDEAAKLPRDSVLCAAIDGADAAPVLLAILRKKDSRFVPASECVYDVNKGSYHAKTGRPAYFVSASNFKALSQDSAQVKLDVRHDGLWGIHRTLLVQSDGGRWHITKVVRDLEN